MAAFDQTNAAADARRADKGGQALSQARLDQRRADQEARVRQSNPASLPSAEPAQQVAAAAPAAPAPAASAPAPAAPAVDATPIGTLASQLAGYQVRAGNTFKPATVASPSGSLNIVN
jgi:biotin carboxyl carrier protein